MGVGVRAVVCWAWVIGVWVVCLVWSEQEVNPWSESGFCFLVSGFLFLVSGLYGVECLVVFLAVYGIFMIIF